MEVNIFDWSDKRAMLESLAQSIFKDRTFYAADHLITFQDLGTDPSGHLFRIVEVKCGSV